MPSCPPWPTSRPASSTRLNKRDKKCPHEEFMRTLFSCPSSSQSPRRRRTSAWRWSIAVTKTGRRAGAGGGGAAGVSASETGSRSNERRATQRSPSRLRSSRVGLVISPMAATNAYVANLSIGHAPFRFPAILCAGRTDCHKERAAPSSRKIFIAHWGGVW